VILHQKFDLPAVATVKPLHDLLGFQLSQLMQRTLCLVCSGPRTCFGQGHQVISQQIQIVPPSGTFFFDWRGVHRETDKVSLRASIGV
jgi:hypothetical protein